MHQSLSINGFPGQGARVAFLETRTHGDSLESREYKVIHTYILFGRSLGVNIPPWHASLPRNEM